MLATMERHKKTQARANLRDLSTSDPKLLRAKAILERDAIRAKKSRLACVLVQQYIKKYGSKTPTSRLNSIIKTFVHNYLESFDGDTTNADIDTLERNVAQMTAEAKTEILTAREETRAKSAEQQRQAMERKNSQRFQEKSGTAIPANYNPNIDLNNWSVVNTMLALKDQEEENAKLKKKNDRKQKFKVVLDEQVQSHLQRGVQAEENKKKELERALNDVEEFRSLEQQKKDAITSQVRTQRDLQMQQIEANKKRQKEDRDKRIEQEKRDMERSKRMAELEQERIQEKKEWTKANNERMKEENEKNKLLKAEAKRQQDEYEMKLNRDYELKLAKEEQDRQNAFANRMLKLSMAAQKYQNSTGTKLEEEKELNSAKVMREIEAKQKADEAREQEKARKRKEEMKISTEYNLQQAERKAQLKREQRAEALATKKRFEEDAAQQKLLDAERKREMLAKREELKGYLDQQVTTLRSKVRNEQALTDEEKMFNRSLIAKIEKDPEMLNKVTQALHPAASQSYSAFAW